VGKRLLPESANWHGKEKTVKNTSRYRSMHVKWGCEMDNIFYLKTVQPFSGALDIAVQGFLKS
jgi:hypothetical protein